MCSFSLTDGFEGFLKRGVGFGSRQFGVFKGFRVLRVEFVERFILIL